MIAIVAVLMAILGATPAAAATTQVQLPPIESDQASAPGLTAFRTRAELDTFLARVRDAREPARRARMAMQPMAVAPPPPPPPPPPMEAAAPAAPGSADNITNNQVAGVDEGGIVKARGDILVVLRRGRLFTVSTANGGMRPVDAIDAFAPGADGRGDWYDEMLVSGDWVAVIGYSYARRGTQVNRFRLDRDGSLRFVDAHSFKSQDYYSSRNYASRLIGNRLVLYAPIALSLERNADSFPTLTRWNETTRTAASVRPLWRAESVFVPMRVRTGDLRAITTVHSVTSCDLTAPVLDCEATSVLGNTSRTFFVSGNAVYVWTGLGATDRARMSGGASALVYRLPLNGGRPQAVAARGMPVDQFSFLADTRRGALQVAVMAQGYGDRMWGPEDKAGRLSLVTIPTGLFGTGTLEVPRERYQLLPGAGGYGLQNRFVGDHLLYTPGGRGAGRSVNVVSLATRAVTPVALPHSVQRLDAIGPDAVAIGQGERFLGFAAIELGATPRLAAEYRLADAAEGESRSHAFFFRPDATDRTGRSGLLGLPVGRQVRSARGFEPSAAITFLRRDDRALAPNGELVAQATGARDDGCRASCVDWYGNARPIFQRDRIFALLGYELVEGQAGQGNARGMREIGRVDMASLVRGGRPGPAAASAGEGYATGTNPAP